jgi:hypothetical protein
LPPDRDAAVGHRTSRLFEAVIDGCRRRLERIGAIERRHARNPVRNGGGAVVEHRVVEGVLTASDRRKANSPAVGRDNVMPPGVRWEVHCRSGQPPTGLGPDRVKHGVDPRLHLRVALCLVLINLPAKIGAPILTAWNAKEDLLDLLALARTRPDRETIARLLHRFYTR